MANIILPPTPRKCASASEREILLLCGRAQVQVKAAALPRVRRTRLRSRAPRPMPPSGRSRHSAIRLGSPSMIASSSVYASVGTSGPHQPWARGCSAQNRAPNEQASTSRVSLPPPSATAMSEARDIEILFALWEQNVETVRAINRHPQPGTLPKSGVAPQLVSHLKRCAVALANRNGNNSVDQPEPRENLGKIDKSVLAIGQPRRIRCKEHLRFVASQPCVICGRTPSHAHHVRYAQVSRIGPQGQR